jgi:hypothetical protein
VPPPPVQEARRKKDAKKSAARAVARLERHAAFRAAAAGELPADYAERKPAKRRRLYTAHCVDKVQLSSFQEFLMFMIYLARGLDKDVLSEKFFACTDKEAVRSTNSILRTWACGLYEILHAERWWLTRERAAAVRVHSSAFSDPDAVNIKALSDCSNVNCQGSQTNELLRQQLYSPYYGSPCLKFCVACSTIGGTMACSLGHGGPADDHQCLTEGADLFEASKWAVDADHEFSQLLYDAGVSRNTKTAAQAVNCDLVTSGIVRKSAKSSLSAQQRRANFRTSSLRIRVENFIGIVKQRFRVLSRIHTNSDLPVTGKVVYVCFMLHNFGFPIIK